MGLHYAPYVFTEQELEQKTLYNTEDIQLIFEYLKKTTDPFPRNSLQAWWL